MRAVIQRVKEASVNIEGKTKSKISNGLLVLLGVEKEDNEKDADWLSSKIAQLRIFNDEQGLMNFSVNDIKAEVLIVSQFTLHAKTKKGTRPSFIHAAKPDQAIPLYNYFITSMQKSVTKEVQTGEFGANMQVQLNNDGPVTIIIDTKNKE